MSLADVDVVVVGAGAAGLAAARTAQALGLSFRVLEAQERIGGRALTDEIVPGMPWDAGAHWLHDARHNALARFAEENGIAFDRTPRHFALWGPGGWADQAVIAEREAYYDVCFEAIDRAGAQGLDIAAAEVMPDHSRYRVMFDCWYAALMGGEPDISSTLDDHRYRNGGNYRVRSGYGALVAAYGKDVPVSLSCPVRRIGWSGKTIEVETGRGTLRARAAIITLSTAALARGALRFEPALPTRLVEAFDGLPLGTAEKVAFAFERDVFGLPENSHVHFLHDTIEQVRFQIRPTGPMMAIGYFAGRFAEQIERDGHDAMVDFAEAKLVEVFGTEVRRARIAARTTHWRSDPYIGGGYSYALPGRSDLRARLGEPVGERLFFAGEAGSPHGFGTVHGAHDMGVAAVRAAHRRLTAGLSHKTTKTSQA